MNKNNRRQIRPAVTTTATAEIALGALSAPAVMNKHIRFCGCAACKPKPVKKLVHDQNAHKEGLL